jgi:hypothetical protein
MERWGGVNITIARYEYWGTLHIERKDGSMDTTPRRVEGSIDTRRYDHLESLGYGYALCTQLTCVQRGHRLGMIDGALLYNFFLFKLA